jgi:hypothetical protein
MDIVEFFKTVNRLCKNRTCGKCPIWKNGTCMANFRDDSVKNIEETISKVEQWAKDHPVKTRQSEFLKVFPKATISNHVLSLCPKFYCVNFLGTDFQECKGINCDKCRCEYWLAEVTDND